MNIFSITALVLVTNEFRPDARSVGDLITTTAPGHVGHCYATYRVESIHEDGRGGLWRCYCTRVVRGSTRNEDGTFSSTCREATLEDIQPGTGLLRDGVVA